MAKVSRKVLWYEYYKTSTWPKNAHCANSAQIPFAGFCHIRSHIPGTILHALNKVHAHAHKKCHKDCACSFVLKSKVMGINMVSASKYADLKYFYWILTINTEKYWNWENLVHTSCMKLFTEKFWKCMQLLKKWEYLLKDRRAARRHCTVL